MLTKFTVSNFKGFNKELIFDLTDTKRYEFNSECVKNGVVNTALVYGHNGVGKSNLGLAIFDLVGHLTDNQTTESRYKFYLNELSSSDLAEFSYEFMFNSDKVEYRYKKKDHKTIVSEDFLINGVLLASINRGDGEEALFKFKGAENLRTSIANTNLSILKYIKNNTELEDNEVNRCFLKFFEFVNGMLFFRSLQENIYIGLEKGVRDLFDYIVEKDSVTDLQMFLNRAGVDCKLTVAKELDRDVLAFDFNGKAIAFYNIASSGTNALLLFYYWFLRIKEENVQFLFIDEFDAFYHHDLSALIVNELKEIGIQFILTTHNTSIITNELLRPDCYFFMSNNRIKSLANRTHKELRQAHNIEKMYKAGSFNEE
jgi:AAA15 family ATPase/GTPase